MTLFYLFFTPIQARNKVNFPPPEPLPGPKIYQLRRKSPLIINKTQVSLQPDQSEIGIRRKNNLLTIINLIFLLLDELQPKNRREISKSNI